MTTTAFLETLFSGCEGLIEVRPLPPQSEHPPRFFHSAIEAEQYAQSLTGKVDVYFGAATRMRDRGTKEDAQEIPALWADCDTHDAVTKITEFPLRPTFEIETSPGRRHVWWHLREPLLLEDQTTIGTVEGVLRGIADILKSDPAVCEVARIMRVPGTLNLKRGGTPCKMLRDDGPRYSLDDFIEIGIFRETEATPIGGNDHGDDPNWVTAALQGVNEPGRNRTAARLAGYFLRKVPPDIARAIVDGFGLRCQPPMDTAELGRVFESISRTVTRHGLRGSTKSGTFETLSNTVNEFLLLADEHILEVVCGTLVANLFKTDPLWLLLVAPPSSAKTEILEGAAGCEVVYPLSDLTTNTLLSGIGKKHSESGQEASLLTRLDGRIIMMKDFGTVLSMHRDKRQEILAQLREVYDRHYSKSWGTGKEVDWHGDVGFIGGVTTAIDTHYAALAMLGERFTLYRSPQPDRKEVALRAITNLQRNGGLVMREAIQAAFRAWYAGIVVPDLGDISCSDDLVKSITRLADLTSLVRTAVARDGYTRFILTRPEAEGPARLSRQFYLLAAGIAIAHGRTAIQQTELTVIKKVATSTMPAQRMDALGALMPYSPDLWVKTRIVANAMRYPTSTMKEILEDLHALRLVEQDMPAPEDSDEDAPGARKRDTTPHTWRLHATARELIESADLDLGGARG